MYQLDYIPDKKEPVKKKTNLIIFVHGLVGGEATWLRTDGQRSLLDYLYSDANLRAHYDFAIYTYFTKFSDLLTRSFYFIKKIYFESSEPFKRNLSIAQISDILKTYLDTPGHENVVFIGHSMGGLVAKDNILKLINEAEDRQRLATAGNKISENSIPKTKLYVSLAVPHEGSFLALYAMLFLKSLQIANLKPFDKFKDDLSEKWLNKEHELPDTLYFRGLNDWVVPEAAAFPRETT